MLALASVLVLTSSGACREDGAVFVDSFELKGVERVDPGRLKAVLATKESSWLPWGRQAAFDRKTFEADLKRITAYYADQGFPDARVSDVDVDVAGDGESVDLTVTIEEGEPTLVGDLVFRGFENVDVEALRARAPLQKGEPLNRGALTATVEMSANALRENGHPYAVVLVGDRPGAETRSVTVVMQADPGPKAVFGPIELVGNRAIDDEILRRELVYQPGDLYRRSALLESQRQLYDLGLFQFVNVEAITGEGRPVEVPTRITVTEDKHRHFLFSGGYGTEEKLRGEVEVRQLNFLGGGRTASVQGKWSSLDRGVRFDFEQPHLFGPRVSLHLQGERWYADEPAYRSVASGGRGTISYTRGLNAFSLSYQDEFRSSRIANWALSDLSLRDELIALGLDPRTGIQDGRLAALIVAVERNTTKNLLDAREGYYASLQVEQAGGWLPGSYQYAGVTAEGRNYIALGNRAVIANRLQFGSIRPADGAAANVPFFRRYFLGGSTTLRGWGRYEVSPLSGSGLPLGGFSLMAATSELRLRLVGNLGMVLFMDAGNVWEDAFTVDLNDVRYDAGTGVRYQTPIGPVRADIAFQLNPIPGLLIEGEPQQRRWRVHFSIGQAF